ncbi:7tm Odorant receptor [Popillia japonica]|uniref:7tm Odorant receptor n=1 Tax=Popillia japonica TaxID=7064 RepID=A0AAW1N4P4_POPJA
MRKRSSPRRSSSSTTLKLVDEKAIFSSKIFFFYNILGVSVYCLFPLFMKESCLKNSPRYLEKYGVPCGVILPLKMPWRYDSDPLFQITAVMQMLTAGLSSIFIVNLTMLVCGLLEHAVHQLGEVRKCVLQISESSPDRMEEAVKFAVKYNCRVIDFVDQINEAFGSQLVMHFTLISLVISVLGFEILIVTHKESVMYILHLIGWFVILYNVCHYGQILINESTKIAEEAYCMPWYDCPVNIQKDIMLIILRSQKPLTLKALSLGTWSDPTFLGVMPLTLKALSLGTWSDPTFLGVI